MTLLLVEGLCVVGVFLTEKERDWAPHWFRVKAMVRFSPAGRGRGVNEVIHAACFLIVDDNQRLFFRFYKYCSGDILK